MNTDARGSVIIQLLDEIRQMRDTVLYLENRILKKRIAVAELMTGVDADLPAGDEPVLPALTREPAPPAVEAPKDPSVGPFFKQYFDQLNGGAFWYDDIAAFVAKLLPDVRLGEIKKRSYGAVSYALKRGKIKRCPGGFCKA